MNFGSVVFLKPDRAKFRGLESNQRLPGSEPGATTSSSYPGITRRILSAKMRSTILSSMDVVPFLLKVLTWGAVIGFALFVGSILAFALAVKLHRKRALKILAASICPSCGKAFGLVAAVAAWKAHVAECQELRRSNQGAKLRIANIWTVKCPHCYATAKFAPETMNLTYASP